MKKILIVALMSLSLIACSQNSKKDGGSVAVAPEKTENKVATSTAANATVILPEISSKYKGVTVDVVSRADNKTISTDIPLGGKVAITGTPITIELQNLFPSFTMADGGVANKTMNEDNPASKVKIYKKDTVVFDAWLFQNFPEVHTYEDPDFAIIMVKLVLK